MTAVLNTADAIRLGSAVVSRVYAGAVQVWPPAAPVITHATASISGDCPGAGNAIGAPDGTWTTGDGVSWLHRWAFAVPGGTSHTITGAMRSTPGRTSLASLDAVTVLVDGVAVAATVTGLGEVPSADATFTATFIGAVGASLEIEIQTSRGGGPPSGRAAVQLDALTIESN